MEIDDTEMIDYFTVEQHFKNSKFKNAINNSLAFLQQNKIAIKYIKYVGRIDVTNTTNIRRKIILVDEKNDENLGDFSMTGNVPMNLHEIFGTENVIHMGIGFEDDVKGHGLSRLIIGELLMKCLQEYPLMKKRQLLFIDEDVSEGFWEHIGMKPNEHADDENYQNRGYGFSKVITFNDIFKWTFGKPMQINITPSDRKLRSYSPYGGHKKTKKKIKCKRKNKNKRMTKCK